MDIIASRTHPTINDWLFSIEPTEYERDDFIPTLVPEAIPKGVINCFEGLAIQYTDCMSPNIANANPVLELLKESLCDGNEEYF